MDRNSVAKSRQQSARTRAIYDKFPYPAPDESSLRLPRWHLAPMDWITAVWRPGEAVTPSSILVAGCGTGREAFMLARKFPQAAMVGLDFNARSIVIADQLRKKWAAMRHIRFLRADLADASLTKRLGNRFDLISCHGVLSYIPNPEQVLANLSRLLNPAGALFLGVNGAAHFSERGRPFLKKFGFNPEEFQDAPQLRRVLDLWDALLETEGRALLNRSAGYLASDLFGPLIQNWPLQQWVSTAKKAGLHFNDSFSAWRQRRSLMEGEHASQLWPRSRAEICLLLDSLIPNVFHRLLFTKRAPWDIPWENTVRLLRARPTLSGLYKQSISRPHRAGLTRVTLKSTPLNTRLDWKMPGWEGEILGGADGGRTIKEILDDARIRAPRRLLVEQLYRMHQLLVLTILP